MAYFLFNGRRCLNPLDVIAAMEAEGIPSDIVTKANTLTLQHGREPSTGYFLVSKKDFDDSFSGDISPEGRSDINTTPITIGIIDYDTSSESYTTVYNGNNFYVTNAVNVLGHKSSDKCVLLVKVQDTRYWFGRIRCYELINFIASNNADVFGLSATPSNFKQNNTLKSGTTFFTVEECVKLLYAGFYSTFYNNTINSPSYTSFTTSSKVEFDDTDLDDYLHNLEFTEGTYLDAFCKICEASRLSFYVYTDILTQTYPGDFTFVLNSNQATWPDFETNKPFHEMFDLADYMIPRRVIAGCLHEDYLRYNDLDTTNRPLHYQFSYENYVVPTDEYENTANVHIFVPHLIMRTNGSVGIDNSTAIDAHLQKIAKRYVNVVAARTRSASWKGFLRLEDKISFGLDKVVYENNGFGFITTAIGTGIDDYNLNYTTPGYSSNYRLPAHVWLYQFKVTGVGYGVITADLYTHDGEETPLTNVSIQDPLSVFTDLGTDDMGLCLQIPTVDGVLYYAIQAPCSGS